MLRFILENELIKLNVIPDNIFSFFQLENTFYGRICGLKNNDISPENSMSNTQEHNIGEEAKINLSSYMHKYDSETNNNQVLL